MTGKTHFKAGMLFYIIFAALLGKYVSYGASTLSGVLTAGIAAILPDIDSRDSLINRRNPIVKAADKAVLKAENIVESLARLVFALALGAAIIYFKDTFAQQIGRIGIFNGNEKLVVYVLAGVVVVIGLSDKNFLSRIPVIGGICRKIMGFTDVIFCSFRKYLVFVFYLSAGVCLAVLNYMHWHDWFIYIVALLPLAALFSPHRSLTHSIEGAVIFITSAGYVFEKIGQRELFFAFAIGYISHLYFTDIFTKEGVPVSILPRLLKKTWIHKRFNTNVVYAFVSRVLNARISLRLMSTGTKKGNVFETIYLSILITVIFIGAILWKGEMIF